MKILYGYTNCTDKKYREIFEGKTVSALLADQKYHSLLIKGLAQNGADVRCVSGLPINRSVTKKLFVAEDDEVEDGVSYHYIKTVNLPVFRQLCIYFGTKKFVENNCKIGEEDTSFVCDCLNLANAYAMLKASKRLKIPLVYVVTDIPEFQRRGALKKINDEIIKNADGFVFLTKQMNEKLNPFGKPYIVLEGHCDFSLSVVPNDERYEFSEGKKVVTYAGSLQKLYGIKNLVDGFLAAQLDSAELWIFGDGDYREQLPDICRSHDNVKYFGVKPNDVIVAAEQRSALLVNPRPSTEEYTKYSFPSKTMEYMVSGTPVLMTRLPGVPEEYFSHVFTIADESAEGVSRALNEFFEIPCDERYAFGERARKFVLSEKSNVVQSGKIVEFLKKVKIR